MPLYEPPAGADPTQLVEDLADQIRDAYEDVETRVLVEVKRLDSKGKFSGDAATRAAALQELQAHVQAIVAQGIPADWAAQVIAIAQTHGTAAAAATLRLAKHLPAARKISTTMQTAVAMLQADLTSRMDMVEQRILRYPVDQLGNWLQRGDVYQRTIAKTAAGPLLNQQTKYQAQKFAMSRFLEQGVTGFTDKADRRWSLGAYSEMATRSAVQRAYTDSSIARMQQSGINLVQIVIGTTACKHCGQWAGKILSTDGTTGTVELPSATTGEPVTVHVDGTIEQARSSGWQHPNCFPGWVPAGSPTGIRAADSRWYEGELVVIHTAEGRELSVTPNHPVLTTEGWVAAGALREGDYLVSYRGHDERPLTGRPDHERVEAPIGEVFQTLRQSSEVSSVLVPVTTEDFHGDGIPDTEVDVVLAHRLLGSDGKPTSLQLAPESKLLLGGMGQRPLLPERAPLQVGRSAVHAAHGIVGSSGEARAFVGGGSAHACVHRRGAPTDVDTMRGKGPTNRLAGDAIGSGELLDALSGLVALDQIVNVRTRPWSGHVYNLTTSGGWYTADSIIVHNCRCHLVAYLAGITNTSNLTRYDPVKEQARDQQRYLERRVRSMKRRSQLADNPTDAKKWAGRARAEQGRIHDLLKDKPYLVRKYKREQVRWAAGRAA